MTDRPGFALVLSLLLTLALMVLALGVLAVGTREAAVAETTVRKARAERLAESAAAHAVGMWSTRAWADLRPGEGRALSVAPPSRGVTVRLDRTLFLVRVEARIPAAAGDVVGTAAVLVRTLPPVDSLVAGAISAETTVTVDAGTVTAGPADGTLDRCAGNDPVPGIVAPVVTVAPAGTVAGDPPVHRVPPPPPPTPDPLAPDLAARIAQLLPTGATGTPRPLAAAGECVPDRRNWGSPDPRHPCYGLLPVVFVDGDYAVVGGAARAVLVVNGDLRIRAGAVLEGVVVVHGHLRIEGGSVIRGAVRARSVHVVDGTVTRDACVVGAVGAAPALDRAYRPPARWWVSGQG